VKDLHKILVATSHAGIRRAKTVRILYVRTGAAAHTCICQVQVRCSSHLSRSGAAHTCPGSERGKLPTHPNSPANAVFSAPTDGKTADGDTSGATRGELEVRHGAETHDTDMRHVIKSSSKRRHVTTLPATEYPAHATSYATTTMRTRLMLSQCKAAPVDSRYHTEAPQTPRIHPHTHAIHCRTTLATSPTRSRHTPRSSRDTTQQ